MTPPCCIQIAQLALNESQIVQRLSRIRRRARTLQQVNSSYQRLAGIGELASALLGESQVVEQRSLGHGVAGGFGQCARLDQKGNPLLQVAGIQTSLGRLSQLLIVAGGWVWHGAGLAFLSIAGLFCPSRNAHPSREAARSLTGLQSVHVGSLPSTGPPTGSGRRSDDPFDKLRTAFAGAALAADAGDAGSRFFHELGAIWIIADFVDQGVAAEFFD